MKKYYTRACNFYYGSISKKLVIKKKTLPLNGNLKISFDYVEVLYIKCKCSTNIKTDNIT